MDKYDAYCAICGMVVRPIYYHLVDSRERWTRDCSVLVVCFKSDGMMELKIIEPPRNPEGGYIYFSNVYVPSIIFSRLNQGFDYLRVYSWNRRHPYVLIFHQACYQMLRGMMNRIWNCLLDNRVLYVSMLELAAKTPHGCQRLEGVDYGEISPLHERNWDSTKAKWWYSAQPNSSPELKAYYLILPRLENKQPESTAIAWKRRNERDLFDKLPAELIHMILEDLSIVHINRLRIASPSVYRLQLNSRFWEKRIRKDLPWTWDVWWIMPYLREDFDWGQAYKNLLLMSTEGRDGSLGILVNRRRIWKIVKQIAVSYFAIRDRAKDEKFVFEIAPGLPATFSQ